MCRACGQVQPAAKVHECAPSEPPELASLPPEVRALVHAVDRMRGHWAESGEPERAGLWRDVHAANDTVWARLDMQDAVDEREEEGR
jgi:hypothetical protein